MKIKSANNRSEKHQTEKTIFVWVFNSGGVLFQQHKEAEYQNYLHENYESKTSSYQYLNSL